MTPGPNGSNPARLNPVRGPGPDGRSEGEQVKEAIKQNDQSEPTPSVAGASPTVAAGTSRAGDETVEALLARLGGSRDGLTSAQADQRLRQVGPNALPQQRRSVLAEAGSFFWGPIP